MAVTDTAAAARRAVDEGADLVDLTGAAPAEVAAFRRAHPGVPVCADAEPADLTRKPAVAAACGARLICTSREAAARSALPPERLLIETSPAGLMTALAAGYPVLVNLPESPAGRIPPGASPPLIPPPPGADSPLNTPPATAPSGAGIPLPASPAEAEVTGETGPGADMTGEAGPGAKATREAAPGAEIPGEAAPGAGALAVAALSGWLGAAVVRTRHPRPVRRALDLTDSVRGARPPARTVRGLA